MQPDLPKVPSRKVVGEATNHYLRWLRGECADFADNPTIFAWFDIVINRIIPNESSRWDRARKKDFAHATGEILDEVREVYHNGPAAVAQVLARSLEPGHFRVRWLGVPSSYPSLLTPSAGPLDPASHHFTPSGHADLQPLPSLSTGLPGMRGRQELPSLRAVFPNDPAIEYSAQQSHQPPAYGHAAHGHLAYSTSPPRSPPRRVASLGMSLLSERKKGIYTRAQRL